jgi:hypothetical protein
MKGLRVIFETFELNPTLANTTVLTNNPPPTSAPILKPLEPFKVAVRVEKKPAEYKQF